MADINRIFIGEYLESLKESKELDHIFPLLLEMMDFTVITTPKNSKGQSQYGKDIVAIKKLDGKDYRFYFELKGGSDRNIDDNVINKKDGIIESLRAAKYTPYIDKGIQGFDSWPARYILVHNGILIENAKPTLNGFIAQEFKEREFERWDIGTLSKIFSENLFNEYLLAEDPETVSLFKKTVVLLDVPEYDLNHFFKLVEILCTKADPSNERVRRKFFSSLSLIGIIIFHYSKSYNNLERAKLCINHLVLKAWHWVLQNRSENRPTVIKSFESLLKTQLLILEEYFEKTLGVAGNPDGLFVEQGSNFEEIGYPLRFSEYLNSLTYYFRLSNHFESENNKEEQIRLLAKLVNSNLDAVKPLLDNQQISYLSVFLFVMENRDALKVSEFLIGFLDKILDSLAATKNVRDRFPEMYNNEEALIEFIATGKRPYNYQDSSSCLVLILFELAVCLDDSATYDKYAEYIKNSKLDLQTYYHDLKTFDIETLLFDREIKDEGYAETTIDLHESFEDFSKAIKAKERLDIDYRTDRAGFQFLRYLAHSYYKTPFLTNEWRKYLDEQIPAIH